MRGRITTASRPTSQPDVKDILEVLDAEPFLPPPIVELCRWVADYYVAGIGDAMAVAHAARREAQGVRLPDAPHGDADRARPLGCRELRAAADRTDLRLSAKQREALAALAEPRRRCRCRSCATAASPPTSSAGWPRAGCVTIVDEAPRARSVRALVMPDVAPRSGASADGRAGAALQQLEALADLREFRVALLHGVTGSGKTELYLRLAQRLMVRSGPRWRRRARGGRC